MIRLEFRILYILALNEGRIIPYSRLIEYAWGYYDKNNSNLLKTHICHIRRKLDLPASGEGSIRSLATVGYSLVRQRRAAVDQKNGATSSHFDLGNDHASSPLDAEDSSARGRRLAAV